VALLLAFHVEVIVDAIPRGTTTFLTPVLLVMTLVLLTVVEIPVARNTFLLLLHLLRLLSSLLLFLLLLLLLLHFNVIFDHLAGVRIEISVQMLLLFEGLVAVR